MSEYVAVAAGEKRLLEILTPGFGPENARRIVETLTGDGVTADYKPRLKAVLLTVPMPDTKTEKPKPEAGGVPPELVPDLEHATRLDGTTMPAPEIVPGEYCWCGGAVGRREPGDALGLGCKENINHNWTAASAESQALIESQSVQPPAPIVPRFGGDFRPRTYADEDDLRDIGIYSDETTPEWTI